MYCNKCGKQNPPNSNFCKYCGAKIETSSNTEFSQSLSDQDKNSQDVEDSKNKRKKEMSAGLTGWLAILGLGLIVGLIIQIYSLTQYGPLFEFEDVFPALHTAIQFEFIFTIIFVVIQIILLALYLSKHKNFPKLYIYFLLGSVTFNVLDHLFLMSLTAPTQEIQAILSESLDQNLYDVGRSIVFSIIWGAYVTQSEKVKATFVNY